MATKKTKKAPKPMPPCRIFFGGQLYHECSYEGAGKAETTFHDSSLEDNFEKTLTKKLTEAGKTILSENPGTGILTL
ncbi:MAG: hypothetical protein IJU51_02070 [Clostridia bacterium]|nr:hypothetical protein [Clostridia bacterium]